MRCNFYNTDNTSVVTLWMQLKFSLTHDIIFLQYRYYFVILLDIRDLEHLNVAVASYFNISIHLSQRKTGWNENDAANASHSY